jgi:hypothetical protein
MRSVIALEGNEVAVVAVPGVMDHGVLGALGDLHAVLVRAFAATALVLLDVTHGGNLSIASSVSCGDRLGGLRLVGSLAAAQGWFDRPGRPITV